MKIICIGRNYAKHAKELNNPISAEPVFFLKPDSAIIRNNKPFFLPDFSKEIHHEVELVIKINRLGRNIPERFAHKYYNEIGIGIDFTARDLQRECKEKGLPWEKAKAFDGSAPIGRFLPKNSFADITSINFHLNKNGETVQRGNTKNMLFSFDQIITYISKFFTLKTGDLIFTGTPSGVGTVEIGDHLECYIEEEKLLEFNVK
ncbi:MAG: fumarylacetoacetate hydrolase family protein [Bacteroidota bacterium]